jgi:hypothetical protein
MVWTDEGGGDHDGRAWVISANTTLDGIHYNISQFKIESGVTITQSAMVVNETETDGLIIQAETIEIVGTINCSAKGHWGGKDEAPWNDDGLGPGGGGGTYLDGHGGCGGGYGGAGGDGQDPVGSGGGTYGGGFNNRYGSGGGCGDTQEGGHGGGLVTLIADDITISGTITNNGGAGEDGGAEGGGGGSGGGILIIGDDIDISNCTFNANGGKGGTNGDDGGGGGGGRIEIYYYGSHTTTSSTLTVTGGAAGGAGGAQAGSAGVTVAAYVGESNSSEAFGWKQKFDTGYSVAVSAFTVYVKTVNTGGDFTLTVYDDEAKGTTYETKTITISGTGDAVFTLDNYQLLDDGTSYYVEIVPDTTGDIVLGINVDYESGVGGFYHHNQDEVVGIVPYLKLDGFSHMIDIDILNTADTDKVLRAASVLLNGATEVINADGSGTYNYIDDFSTEKYLVDVNAISGDTYQSGTDDVDIADDGYVYWLVDVLYTITGDPIFTANIDVTAGTPTIQVAKDLDGSPDNWYDIDTAIVDNASTEYTLISTAGNVSFDGESKVWVRIDCAGAGTVTCTITSIEIDANLITIDASIPLIETGGANTFKINHDGVGDIAGTVSLIYPDRRYA